MLLKIDLGTIRFGEPLNLWLLVFPAVLLALWIRSFSNRRRDARRFLERRSLPFRQRFSFFGSLSFWLCVILAATCTAVALARPRARVSLLRTGGIDLVILQDGSASMRVKDVPGDRWQRSMTFLRVLGDSLSWTDDRVAMALFAHVATPQIRLTKDPNTYFFFLDHLAKEPPFRLEDDTTWDTNIELGIHWGLRLIEKDEELYGQSANAKAFVLISDGQVWSGELKNSLKQAVSLGIPVYVVGVGTTAGGPIPDPTVRSATGEVTTVPGGSSTPERSVLDRPSLQTIAAEGGGQYFEIGLDRDREIASQILDAARRRSGSRDMQETTQELYWRFLLAAACLVGLGVLFLQERTELWLQVAGAAMAFFVLSTIFR